MAYQNQKVKARQTITQTNQSQTIGIVSEVPMGDWNATINYQKLNKVRYASTGGIGATLLAKKANQGVEPFVSNGWQDVWMVENYDGLVTPVGVYPNMTAGNATNAQNDGTGANIANQFSEITSDIQGLREDVTNESHFRGMFMSVETLKAAYPTATPNDYAYIVGGNIYIWQNNAWADSQQPSPNTSVPASNAMPLMDGTASAGTSSAYARGDHRHPSDTSKVNKSGDTMTGPIKAPRFEQGDSTKDHIDLAYPNTVFGIRANNASVYDLQQMLTKAEAALPYLGNQKNANTDFNNLKLAQCYNTTESKPTENGHWIIGAQSSANYGSQFACSDNGNAYFRALSSGVWSGWETFLKMDTSKLTPSTANGWTVGDATLKMNKTGVFLVAVASSGDSISTAGVPGIMILRDDTLLGVHNFNGICLANDTQTIIGAPCFIEYHGTINDNNSGTSGIWKLRKITGTTATTDPAFVAYKQIA